MDNHKTSKIVKPEFFDDSKVEGIIQELILKNIPSSGETIGNKKLYNIIVLELKKIPTFSKCQFNMDMFWKLRNELISDNVLSTGRGKGGSVFKTNFEKNRRFKTYKEKDLYEPFYQYITKRWSKENLIENYVCEITGSQGKRDTGGKWTRPDLAMVAVRSYPFIPGKILEVTTFEIKTNDGYGIESVYETASHSQYANHSILAIYTPNGLPESRVFSRIENECKRFHIGLMIFDEINNLDSYELRVESEWKSPDPVDVNSFITKQMNKISQHKLLSMLK